MGSGSSEGGGSGNPGGARAVWDHSFAARGRAGEDGGGVEGGGGRGNRIGATVDVVGDAGRCRRDSALRAGERYGSGRDKCRGSGRGAQRGIYKGACACAAPSGAFPCSGVCAAVGARRNGRRAPVVQPARRSAEITTTRLPLFVRGSGCRPRGGSLRDLRAY